MEQPPISDPSGQILPGTLHPHVQPPDDVIGLVRAQRLGTPALLISLCGEVAGGYFKYISDELDKTPNPPPSTVILALTLLGGITIVLGFRVYVVYRLANHLRVRPAFIPAGLGFLGCIGLYLLYTFNKNAAKKLRAAGLRVGTFGVTEAELARYQAAKASVG